MDMLKALLTAIKMNTDKGTIMIQSTSECFYAGDYGEACDDAWVVYKDMVVNGYPVAKIKHDVQGWQGLIIEGIEGNSGNRFDRLSDVEKADIGTIVLKIAQQNVTKKNTRHGLFGTIINIIPAIISKMWKKMNTNRGSLS
jgi:hypothetical protein